MRMFQKPGEKNGNLARDKYFSFVETKLLNINLNDISTHKNRCKSLRINMSTYRHFPEC